MTVEAIRVRDARIVIAIMTREDMWKTVAEDGIDPQTYCPDTISDCWLLIVDESEPIGLYQIHAHNAIMIEMHANILPKHRAKYAYDAGLAALTWVYEKAPEYKKIVVNIPVIYKHIKRYAEKYGFIQEGINRQSYQKNGEVHDMWLLGMTREELRGLVNGQCS